MYAPHTKWHTANGGTLARGSLLRVALMVMPFHDIYNAFMGVTQAELTIITYPTPPATDPLEPFCTPSLSDI